MLARSPNAEDPRATAQRLYDAAGQDDKAAIAAIVAEAGRRPHFAAFLIHQAAMALVNAVRRHDNNVIIHANNQNAPTHNLSSAAHVAAVARAQRTGEIVAASLMGMRFKYDGRVYVLGDSTGEELRPVAAHYIGQGATMLRRGRWIEKVIAVAGARKVKDAMTDKQLRKLQAEANSSPV